MEPAKELFNRFRERGIDEIRELVQRKQEETIFLEFKRKSHPTKAVLNDDDKKNYSVALSGFANSEGGVIVWGVKAAKLDPESPDVATWFLRRARMYDCTDQSLP
jgi:hypothetical protein